MLVALLIVAGAAAVPGRTIDQRVNLLEARQMLQSQAVWSLQAAMTPDAAKALNDLDLHLAQDRDRDEKMEKLEQTISTLEQRLAAVELLLGDRTLAESSPVRVAQPKPPPMLSDLVIKVKPPQAKAAKAKHSKAQAAGQPGSKSPPGEVKQAKPGPAVSSQP